MFLDLSLFLHAGKAERSLDLATVLLGFGSVLVLFDLTCGGDYHSNLTCVLFLRSLPRLKCAHACLALRQILMQVASNSRAFSLYAKLGFEVRCRASYTCAAQGSCV